MSPLDPITASLRAAFGTSTALRGLAPDLIVPDAAGWQPASALAGPLLEVLLDAAARHWAARPPAAAALAWKTYTYWLSLPAVAGFVAARRVPALTSENVLVRLDLPDRLLVVGLRPVTPVAVLPGDPVAAGAAVEAEPGAVVEADGTAPGAVVVADGTAPGVVVVADGTAPGVVVVADEAALAVYLKRVLVDEHLTPLIEAVTRRSRLGERLLLGSLAANVAAVALRLGGAAQAARLTAALGVGDLVDVVADVDGRVRVRRKTCCLAFSLPRPKICQDCCLRW